MIDLDRNALVWGIVGNLGGGKSLSAVAVAVRAISDGFYVCSNITLNLSWLRDRYGSWVDRMYMHIDLDDEDFDPFKLPCGDPRGSGGKRRVVVILDEVAEWVDQYTNAKEPRIKRLWSWLRHSSKRSQDVFVVCQRREYINKVVRTLIARWVWVDDLAVYRVPLLKMRIPFCSGFVMQNVFDRNGNKIGSVSFLRKTSWGRFYDTAECLNLVGSSYNSVYQAAPPINRDFLFLYLLYGFSFVLLVWSFCGVKLSALPGRAQRGPVAADSLP